ARVPEARTPSTQAGPRTSVRRVIDGTTVGWCLLAALGHPMVANNGGDAQAIVSENALAAGRLRGAVTSTRAPASDRATILAAILAFSSKIGSITLADALNLIRKVKTHRD